MNNPYEVLGVSKSATHDEIRKAYKKLAKEFHPDKNPDNDQAITRFKEIAEAYEILGDEEKRAHFDRYGSTQGQRPFTNPEFDFFNSFFTGFRQTHARRKPQGAAIVATAFVTLEQVLTGTKLNVKYSRKPKCQECKGFGGETGECDRCGGRGVFVTHEGNMAFQSVCPSCQGLKQVVTKPCESCKNGFGDSQEHEIELTVPPGCEDGRRFVFSGLGEESAHGTAGSLNVYVRYMPHKFFEVLGGGNLGIKVPISYTQLVFGDSIDVPTLDGIVSMKVPAECPAAANFSLRRQGLPRGIDVPARGDIIVILDLKIPTILTSEHLKIMKELQEYERNQHEGTKQ